jgi:SAM-dependent methyltransferase
MPTSERQPLIDRRAAAPYAPRHLGGPVSLSVIVPVYNERHLVQASIRGVLALTDPIIERLEVIAVDDGSTDGSGDLLDDLARDDSRLVVIRQARNAGKGACVRTGLARATGEITIIHDADLEYNPQDIPAVLRPFVEQGADAVFGSRYLVARYRRALRFRHSLMNRSLTTISNIFSDLDLTDLETCYKAVRTTLLKSIPIRSRDFRIEVELALKLAKRRAHIFEVPITYLPRSYAEGKKIGVKDGLLALATIVQFTVWDDLYLHDEYGSQILHQLERTRRFTLWMCDTLRPLVGDRVLEIGAGIATLTEQFIPRARYVVGDINPNYLHYLDGYALGKPYLEVRKVDAVDARDFQDLRDSFDTVIMINVLEHVHDEAAALANVRSALSRGGHAVILVPQGPHLYGTLDTALAHRERYTRAGLRASLERAGLEVVSIQDFNRFSVPGWWLNGKILKRQTFSRVQLKLVDTAVPVIRHVDRWFPWDGQSLIAVARQPR